MDSNDILRHIASMQGYVPGEQPGDIEQYIKLNTNENPYSPSPKVMEAIEAATAGTLCKYPDPTSKALRKIAARQFELPEETIMVGNGSDELLAYICRTVLAEGDTVCAPDPTYSLYPVLADMVNARYMSTPLRDDFSMGDVAGYDDAKVVFIANPNAPTGRSLEVERVAEVCEATSGLVVVDEAYMDFCRPSRSSVGLLKSHSNLVVVRTLSKSYSLAGMRIGLLLGPLWLIEELNKVRDSYNINVVSQAAGCTALEDSEWMQENVSQVIATRDRMTTELQELGFETVPSDANFILTRPPDGLAAESLYNALKKRKILVRHFADERVREYVRISVGTEDEIDALLVAVREILDA